MVSEISKALKKLIDNPDDLSELPQLVAKVEEMEQQEQTYQERINTLQQINKNYLAQIPIPNQEPEPDQDDTPTLEDAQQYLIETLGGQ